MSLSPRVPGEVPARTAEVARQAFPKGCLCMRIRKELGPLFTDEDFVDLFPRRGQPAWPPYQLALVSVLQFLEGLSDRQAASAVRARIDWKFLLGLELTDPGFDFSLLSEFRDRNIADGHPDRILNVILDRLREAGLLKRPGRQRTDSTHVLSAVRRLSRLEKLAKHLRAALNALAEQAPSWLAEQVPADWYDRYGRRVEDWRLPHGEQKRTACGEQIGEDGMRLLQVVHSPGAPGRLRALPAVEALRTCWVQGFMVSGGRVRVRTAKDVPPSRLHTESPYDPEVRYAARSGVVWSGYRVHLSEVCDEDAPRVITHVATTVATVTDVEMTESVPTELAAVGLLAGEHLVDRGYVNAELLATSVTRYAVELIGPVREDVTWQGRAREGFDTDSFAIDWDAGRATCPQGKESVQFVPHRGRAGRPTTRITFDQHDCELCPVRAHCTRKDSGPRTLNLGTRTEHEAIRRRRHERETKPWRRRYQARSGVEAAIGQGLLRCGMRRSR